MDQVIPKSCMRIYSDLMNHFAFLEHQTDDPSGQRNSKRFSPLRHCFPKGVDGPPKTWLNGWDIRWKRCFLRSRRRCRQSLPRRKHPRKCLRTRIPTSLPPHFSSNVSQNLSHDLRCTWVRIDVSIGMYTREGICGKDPGQVHGEGHACFDN